MVGNAVIKAVKAGISIYAAHTNADKVIAGVSGAMAARLGLKDVTILADEGDGTGLGIMPEDFASYETLCVSLDPGSTVMMYTDGMTEAINSFEEEFGTQRLIDAFSESCKNRTENSEIINDLMNAVKLFEREQADDQTVVLIHRNGRA